MDWIFFGSPRSPIFFPHLPMQCHCIDMELYRWILCWTPSSSWSLGRLLGCPKMVGWGQVVGGGWWGGKTFVSIGWTWKNYMGFLRYLVWKILQNSMWHRKNNTTIYFFADEKGGSLRTLKTLPENDMFSRDLLLSPSLWAQPSARHTLRCTRFPWQCHGMSKEANVEPLKGVNQRENHQ